MTPAPISVVVNTLDAARVLAFALRSVESWAAVENLLLSYDEQGPPMTVVRNA